MYEHAMSANHKKQYLPPLTRDAIKQGSFDKSISNNSSKPVPRLTMWKAKSKSVVKFLLWVRAYKRRLTVRGIRFNPELGPSFAYLT